jgi:hypothetical protein
MRIRIQGVGRRIHLMSNAEFQRALAADEVGRSRDVFRDDASACGFVRRHCRGPYEHGMLRRALACDVHDVDRLSDDDVVLLAARRLRSGAWRIGYERPPRAPAADGASPRRVASVFGTPLGGATVPRAQRRPASAPPPARAPAPAPDPEWSEDADQAAFAGVLVQAAATGAPFCEICAAQRAQPAPVP